MKLLSCQLFGLSLMLHVRSHASYRCHTDIADVTIPVWPQCTQTFGLAEICFVDTISGLSQSVSFISCFPKPKVWLSKCFNFDSDCMYVNSAPGHQSEESDYWIKLLFLSVLFCVFVTEFSLIRAVPLKSVRGLTLNLMGGEVGKWLVYYYSSPHFS